MAQIFLFGRVENDLEVKKARKILPMSVSM